MNIDCGTYSVNITQNVMNIIPSSFSRGSESYVLCLRLLLVSSRVRIGIHAFAEKAHFPPPHYFCQVITWEALTGYLLPWCHLDWSAAIQKKKKMSPWGLFHWSKNQNQNMNILRGRNTFTVTLFMNNSNKMRYMVEKMNPSERQYQNEKVLWRDIDLGLNSKFWFYHLLNKHQIKGFITYLSYYSYLGIMLFVI